MKYKFTIYKKLSFFLSFFLSNLIVATPALAHSSFVNFTVQFDNVPYRPDISQYDGSAEKSNSSSWGSDTQANLPIVNFGSNLKILLQANTTHSHLSTLGIVEPSREGGVASFGFALPAGMSFANNSPLLNRVITINTRSNNCSVKSGSFLNSQFSLNKQISAYYQNVNGLGYVVLKVPEVAPIAVMGTGSTLLFACENPTLVSPQIVTLNFKPSNSYSKSKALVSFFANAENILGVSQLKARRVFIPNQWDTQNTPLPILLNSPVGNSASTSGGAFQTYLSHQNKIIGFKAYGLMLPEQAPGVIARTSPFGTP